MINISLAESKVLVSSNDTAPFVPINAKEAKSISQTKEPSREKDIAEYIAKRACGIFRDTMVYIKMAADRGEWQAAGLVEEWNKYGYGYDHDEKIRDIVVDKLQDLGFEIKINDGTIGLTKVRIIQCPKHLMDLLKLQEMHKPKSKIRKVVLNLSPRNYVWENVIVKVNGVVIKGMVPLKCQQSKIDYKLIVSAVQSKTYSYLSSLRCPFLAVAFSQRIV